MLNPFLGPNAHSPHPTIGVTSLGLSLFGPYVEANGRLNFNGLGIKSLDDTRLPDAWGKLFTCPGASDPVVIGGVPPVRYGRWVQNALNTLGTSSNTIAGWGATNATISTNTFTTTSAGGFVYEEITGAATTAEDWNARTEITVDIPCSVRISFEEVGGTVHDGYYAAFTAGQTQTIAHLADGTPATLVGDGTDLRMRIQCDTDAATITVDEIHPSNVTGQSDQNPGEYEPSGTPIGNQKALNGEFDVWTDPTVPDYWAKVGSHNGTNYLEESPDGALHIVSDGTNVGMRQTSVLNVGSLYHYTIVVSACAGTLQLRNYSGTTTIKSITAAGTYTGTFVADDAGLTVMRGGGAVDATASALTVKEATTGLGCYIKEINISVSGGILTTGVGVDLSPYPQIEHWPGSTNHFINSDAPITQTIDFTAIGTGDYTISLGGSGTVTSADVGATGTGHGVASAGSDLTFNLSVAGTVSFTVAGGPPTWVMVNKGSYASPHILTAGVATARAVTELYHPDALDYINQGAGTVTMKVGFPLAASIRPAVEAALTINDASAINILHLGTTVAGRLSAYDGTNTASKDVTAWAADDVMGLFSSWITGGVIDVGGRNITDDTAIEVDGAPPVYDGAWPESGGELLFFVGMDQPAILHDYKIYAKKLPNDTIAELLI